MSNRYKLLAPVAGFLLSALPLLSHAEFVDVLDLPARTSELAAHAPLTDVTRAGARLVAAGQRGHILHSDDAGQHWQQAAVPVSSDLNALYFANAEQGWAVGHDGVILHSSDGGRSWNKQLDGRQIGPLLQEHYSRLLAAEPDREEWQLRLADAERLVLEGADKPLLDVWFANPQEGYAIGVFGLILRTEDGGQHWQPFAEHTENPQSLHLNAITAAAGVPYIVGEQGLLLKWDGSHFAALQSPYPGSFFGAVGDSAALLVHGLRGHVFASGDGGTSWTRLSSGVQASITSSSQDSAGRFYLFSQTGQVLRMATSATAPEVLALAEPNPISAATFAANGTLVTVGPRGVRSLPLE